MDNFQMAILRIKALKDTLYKLSNKSLKLQKEKDKIIQLKEKILKLKNSHGLDLISFDFSCPEIKFITSELFELSKVNYAVKLDPCIETHDAEIWVVRMECVNPNITKYFTFYDENTLFAH